MAQQTDLTSRGLGTFYNLYGSNATASAMTAWVWGVSRIIDIIEETPQAHINTQRIGVTGCSRDGKGALMAGAFDTRIALTIPQESGSGGDAGWRISLYEQDNGAVVQTATEIVRKLHPSRPGRCHADRFVGPGKCLVHRGLQQFCE